jgi:4-hydroxyacetophenone monooxygenase
MTLDAATTELLAQFSASGTPPLEQMTLAEARSLGGLLRPMFGVGPAMHDVTDDEVTSGDGGSFRVRTYRPLARTTAVVVYFHGGGWTVGSVAESDVLMRRLAERTASTVVAVDYRLAPEHPFPAAVVDADAAVRWAASRLRDLAGGDVPLVVAGDSAGGNLATVVARRARDAEDGPDIALQVLVYPVTDCDLTTPSYLDPANQLMLTAASMRWFWNHYLPDPELRANPDASPLRAADLAGLPPAIVVSAEHDPLRDEGEAYARRLAEAGVAVTHRRFDGQMHGFFTMVNLPGSVDALEFVADAMAARLGWTPSPFAHLRVAPLDATDDELAEHLRDAEILSLLQTLAYLTDDLSILRDDLRPNGDRYDPTRGLSPQKMDEARELALTVLGRFRDGGCRAADRPSEQTLQKIITWGMPLVEEDFLPLLSEELVLAGDDPRAPAWTRRSLAPEADFQVVVVGAGMSGLLAAYRLSQAGVDYQLFEKNDEVGGTWFENQYPGCRVDVPSHSYCYSFAPRLDWSDHFSTQDVLLDYFRDFADTSGVRQNISFGTEVTRAEYDDDLGVWKIDVRSVDGERTVRANAFICATGQLNQPSLPDIPGLADFAGPAFHSARWDHDVELAGKRVAIVGTGASAFQFIPIVAERAGQLTVFQRTPGWLIPTPEVHDAIPENLRWLLRHVPFYEAWYRFSLFAPVVHGGLQAAIVDPDYPPGERAVSALNDQFREMLTGYLTAQLPDRPDLLAAVLPTYPPMAKRTLRDNGVYLAALKRENVEVRTDGIQRITPRGVVTMDGVEHQVDVIIYGTGFRASDFLTPMTVVGRGGADLHTRWHGDARAYLGITVPGFPNLFLLYGPNTNLVIHGSIVMFSECEVAYVMDCLRYVLEGGHRAIDCRPEAHDRYNAWIDEGNALRAWGYSKVSSWYKNATGRSAQNWPYSILEFWRRTRQVDPADYEPI